jgi:hypothetical protein
MNFKKSTQQTGGIKNKGRAQSCCRRRAARRTRVGPVGGGGEARKHWRRLSERHTKRRRADTIRAPIAPPLRLLILFALAFVSSGGRPASWHGSSRALSSTGARPAAARSTTRRNGTRARPAATSGRPNQSNWADSTLAAGRRPPAADVPLAMLICKRSSRSRAKAAADGDEYDNSNSSKIDYQLATRAGEDGWPAAATRA